VVIAIIGILVALLLSAVQVSREAARMQQCRNHLRQLALAALNHEAAHGHLPTGGWGASWTGDPERGFDKEQPGGWTYNVLPYLEQESLRNLGAGLNDSDKPAALAQVMQSPLELFHCPSRREVRLYPHAWRYTQSNSTPTDLVARSDYAINAGDSGSNTIVIGNRGGPPTLAEGDTTFFWPSSAHYTGVSYLRSQVQLAQIVDGTSSTYLIGEKSLDIRDYTNGLTESDRGHVFIGFAPDTVRLANEDKPPRQDGDFDDRFRFGSAHVSVCLFALCDGSVRAVHYDIDAESYRQHGNREDGG
jgi:hypothetical protein